MMNLPLSRVADESTKASLRLIQDAYNESEINLAGFKLFTITTKGAVTSMQMIHALGFIPTDLIVTRISGGTVTWDYDSFTKTKIQFTTSGAVTIRFLLGAL